MENVNQQINQSTTFQPVQNNSSQQTAEFKKASFLHRTLAYFVDFLILFLLGIAIGIIVSLTKIKTINLLSYFVGFFYSVYFIGSNGATPGMKLLKLKVVNTGYQKINYSTAIGRTLASILSSLVVGLGYYWVLIDGKRQTWHDKLANTYVVKLNDNNLIPVAADEPITTGQKVLFALAAFLLPGIAIFAILLAVTLIAINPAKQFSLANNTKRHSDVVAIENAILQYAADHNNQIPQGITSTPEEISSQGANLCSELVPSYLPSLPVDPTVNKGLEISNCQSSYETGYTISLDAQGHVTIKAPKAELNNSISVTR